MYLAAIGKLKPGPEKTLFDKYAVRLLSPLKVIEIPEKKGSTQDIRKKESEALLAAIAPNSYMVALDEGGQEWSSIAFADRLAVWQAHSHELGFVIGGTEGLTKPVLQRANAVMSLGKMTWPHFLVRALLVEQLYRVQCIHQGHPYHKTGRPI
ncbi:23S rRNA (pseudouridine(1915)-N(3))-methyltransferase RlmH [Entomobacter blattae]|uniref:Ribosomal RNA large subunit methyltransferase H n=1 Tax=Entomobacter blattae TaxID=2762277 RepID=A0A7H1NQA0_9PROT|nr:23S rRNA (pseudouridine(1915)-N(3))-methyltransferase RlmH [Entomobacter blattae]QNT77960.1 Ribosomal RNA large subunit methyltransferase H [Entomobacter blattae]